MAAWSPSQYLKFEDERTRPAAELLARVALDHPRRILDVGCGPGNSTELLAARYPHAEIVGIDSSPEMIAAARQRLPQAKFVVADVVDYLGPASHDLVFANAVLQWVPRHLDLVTRLLEEGSSESVIALQVPDNRDEPTHRLMAEVAREGPWRARFDQPIARDPIPTPADYYDRLRPFAASIDIWHTTYYHALADAAAIVEWVDSTGLRPWLDRLAPDERRAYLAIYTERVAEAYAPLVDGRVLLRFPRLFVVAVRG